MLAGPAVTALPLTFYGRRAGRVQWTESRLSPVDAGTGQCGYNARCQPSHLGGQVPMATFITTVQFTEQGVKAVRDSCERAGAFKAAAEKMGVKVAGLYWTLGAFDGVIVLEAPDEQRATAALLHLGSQGNLRTQTARAFDAAEMQKV